MVANESKVESNPPSEHNLPQSEYGIYNNYEVYNSKYNQNNNSNNRSSWLGNLNNNSNRETSTRQTRETKTTTRRAGRTSESVPPPRTKRVPLSSRKSDGVKSQTNSSRNNGNVLYFDLV